MRAAGNVTLEISCYHGVEGVREFSRAFGADRVLLGTGYGLQYAGIGVGKVETADISEDARALVGRENARRLLGL
jgi:predicted TIM-barrel fold metal-dependent hydrolase